MSALVSDLVNETLMLVGEMSGTSVQTYSEDQVKAEVVRSFNLLFKKRFWNQYSGWVRVALDGTTGIMTTDALEYVLDFEDIFAVCVGGSSVPLPILSRNVNPFTLTGNAPRYWTGLKASHASYNLRKIITYPITSEGNIDIGARFYPIKITDNWTMDDTMHLDKDMLVYGAAFMTLVGDDLNPGQAEVCKTMMEMKYRDIVSSLASQKISISGNDGIPNEWQERS